jgi:hypothetical protein
MESDSETSTVDLSIDFDFISDLSTLEEPQWPLPVWKDFKAFNMGHYRKISAFFMRPPTTGSVQTLLRQHATVPRDGKPRALVQYFVGLILERCGSQTTGFSGDRYTKEALNAEFAPSTVDLSSVCLNCHRVHPATVRSPSTASSKGKGPVALEKELRRIRLPNL